MKIDIYDQSYNVNAEGNAEYLTELAAYVDLRMREVAEAARTVDSLKVAVLAALNIADEYHLLKRRLEKPSPDAHQRATKLASALDEVLQDGRRTG